MVLILLVISWFQVDRFCFIYCLRNSVSTSQHKQYKTKIITYKRKGLIIQKETKKVLVYKDRPIKYHRFGDVSLFLIVTYTYSYGNAHVEFYTTLHIQETAENSHLIRRLIKRLSFSNCFIFHIYFLQTHMLSLYYLRGIHLQDYTVSCRYYAQPRTTVWQLTLDARNCTTLMRRKLEERWVNCRLMEQLIVY